MLTVSKVLFTAQRPPSQEVTVSYVRKQDIPKLPEATRIRPIARKTVFVSYGNMPSGGMNTRCEAFTKHTDFEAWQKDRRANSSWSDAAHKQFPKVDYGNQGLVVVSTDGTERRHGFGLRQMRFDPEHGQLLIEMKRHSYTGPGIRSTHGVLYHTFVVDKELLIRPPRLVVVDSNQGLLTKWEDRGFGRALQNGINRLLNRLLN